MLACQTDLPQTDRLVRSAPLPPKPQDVARIACCVTRCIRPRPVYERTPSPLHCICMLFGCRLHPAPLRARPPPAGAAGGGRLSPCVWPRACVYRPLLECNIERATREPGFGYGCRPRRACCVGLTSQFSVSRRTSSHTASPYRPRPLFELKQPPSSPESSRQRRHWSNDEPRAVQPLPARGSHHPAASGSSSGPGFRLEPVRLCSSGPAPAGGPAAAAGRRCGPKLAHCAWGACGGRGEACKRQAAGSAQTQLCQRAPYRRSPGPGARSRSVDHAAQSPPAARPALTGRVADRPPPAPAGRRSLVVVAGNKGEGGPFAPLVVVTRNIMGTKEFNQFRGKAISLHSQSELCCRRRRRAVPPCTPASDAGAGRAGAPACHRHSRSKPAGAVAAPSSAQRRLPEPTQSARRPPLPLAVFTTTGPAAGAPRPPWPATLPRSPAC